MITQAQFDAMQARVRLAKHATALAKDPTPAFGVAREGDLHNEIISYCKAQGWIFFHGSMAHRTYRTIGEPDFVCLLPFGMTLFLECKTKNAKLTHEQNALAIWMKKLGHELHIIRSLADLQIIAEQILKTKSENDLGNSP